jgi:hypothetical protein
VPSQNSFPLAGQISARFEFYESEIDFALFLLRSRISLFRPSHSHYTIAPAPDTDSLPDKKEVRFFLKAK